MCYVHPKHLVNLKLFVQYWTWRFLKVSLLHGQLSWCSSIIWSKRVASISADFITRSLECIFLLLNIQENSSTIHIPLFLFNSRLILVTCAWWFSQDILAHNLPFGDGTFYWVICVERMKSRWCFTMYFLVGVDYSSVECDLVCTEL